MNCETCGDRGLVLVNWTDAPADYAVCLCAAGQRWRVATNNGTPCTPHWQIWAHQAAVPLDRMFMLEEVCEPQELALRGFSGPTPTDTLSAVAAAARGRSAR